MKKIIKYSALGALLFVLPACSANKNAETVDSDTVAVEEAATVDDFADSAVAKNVGADFLKDTGATADSLHFETTESGLKIATVKEGTGKAPSATSQVMVHYTGRHPNGEVFDSSVERGEPTTFPLNGVIAGWTEGLQLMKEGGKAVLYVPANLAYGERGIPQAGIQPNEPLTFEVELIKIVD